MRIILLGPPGCGKGTQAELLSAGYCLEHIATGDILRAAIAAETPHGARAKPYVAAGHLVPDDLVNDIVAERLAREPRPARFVLDGYPRRLAQAQALDAVLERLRLPLTRVVLIDAPDEEIVRRVSGRWSCPRPGCKATYHTENNPPRVPGVCDRDGTRLVQRSDDRPETVRERLKVYHHDTEELIPFYQALGLLHPVSGLGAIDEVNRRIVAVLGPQAGPSC